MVVRDQAAVENDDAADFVAPLSAQIGSTSGPLPAPALENLAAMQKLGIDRSILAATFCALGSKLANACTADRRRSAKIFSMLNELAVGAVRSRKEQISN